MYKIPGRSFSTDNIIKDLSALTNYTITVRATNNGGFYSETSFTVKSKELGMLCLLIQI